MAAVITRAIANLFDQADAAATATATASAATGFCRVFSADANCGFAKGGSTSDVAIAINVTAAERTRVMAASRSVAGCVCFTSDSSPQPPRTARDRKSTRLNSSHVRISYAVFCLKKKKKIRHATRLAKHKH